MTQSLRHRPSQITIKPLGLMLIETLFLVTYSLSLCAAPLDSRMHFDGVQGLFSQLTPLRMRTALATGHRILSVTTHGASFWATTSRINTQLSDGT